MVANPEQELLVSEDGRWCWDGLRWRQLVDRPDRILWRADRQVAPAADRPTPRPRAPSLQVLELEEIAPEPGQPRVGLVGELLNRVRGAAIRPESRRRELDPVEWREQIRTEIAEPPARIAVGSAKGGVGKTTTSLALAAALGRLRCSRVLACETHHVAGYAARLPVTPRRSSVELLQLIQATANLLEIGLPTLDRYTTQVPEDRFCVLPAPHDAAAARVLGEHEHRLLLSLLSRYFDVLIADLDPALLHSGTAYWLGQVADQVVVVSSTTASGVELADSTIDYLEARRSSRWVRERVLVAINAVRGDASEVRAIEGRFRQRVGRVHRIPWDAHLEEGGVFAWDRLHGSTRDAYLRLAASVGSGFALGQSPGGERASQETPEP